LVEPVLSIARRPDRIVVFMSGGRKPGEQRPSLVTAQRLANGTAFSDEADKTSLIVLCFSSFSHGRHIAGRLFCRRNRNLEQRWSLAGHPIL